VFSSIWTTNNTILLAIAEREKNELTSTRKKQLAIRRSKGNKEHEEEYLEQRKQRAPRARRTQSYIQLVCKLAIQ